MIAIFRPELTVLLINAYSCVDLTFKGHKQSFKKVEGIMGLTYKKEVENLLMTGDLTSLFSFAITHRRNL